MKIPSSVLCIVWSVGCIDNSIPSAEYDTGVSASWSSVDEESAGDSMDRVVSSVAILEGLNASDGSAQDRTPDCGVRDLHFKAEMRDVERETVEVGYPTDRHRVWARIHNPCDHAVELKTETSCLIEGWRIAGDWAHPSLGSFPCGGAERIRTVPAGGFIEQEATPLHDLGVGLYEISVVFGHKVNAYGGRAEAILDYEVLSRFGS